MTRKTNKWIKIQTLLDKLYTLKNFLNGFKKFSKYSFTGDKETLLDVADVKKTVFDAWGHTKIHTIILNPEDNMDEFENSARIFNHRLGLNFEPSELQIIKYYLGINISGFYLVSVFLAPGFAYAHLDTGKVAWGIDVISNDKFLKELVRGKCFPSIRTSLC